MRWVLALALMFLGVSPALAETFADCYAAAAEKQATCRVIRINEERDCEDGVLQTLLECQAGCAQSRIPSCSDQCQSDYTRDQGWCLDIEKGGIDACDREAESDYEACRRRCSQQTCRP
jgi:hypothetical protein